MAFAPVPFRVARISSRLLFGTAPTTTQDRDALLALRVTDVLDLRAEVTAEQAQALWVGTPVRYHRDPIVDNGRPKPAATWVQGVGIVRDALARSPSAVVYVHCHAGQYRSAAMVYGVLRAAGYSARDAWATVQAARSDTFRQYVPSVDAAVRSLPTIAPSDLGPMAPEAAVAPSPASVSSASGGSSSGLGVLLLVAGAGGLAWYYLRGRRR